MNDSRTAPRLRSLLKGKIVYNNRLSTMDCVVRDISAGGARLAVAHHNVLPDRFELYVPLKQKTYLVQVRWRAEEDIGVMFLDGQETASTAASGDADLRSRVEHLETEVAALHGILEKLMSKLRSP